MTPEIHQLMKELVTVFENNPWPPIDRVKLPPAARDYPSGRHAGTYKAILNYTSQSLTQLTLHVDDSIVVYESMEDSRTYIGYNTRTRVGGRFPANKVDWVQAEPEINHKLVVCTEKSPAKLLADDLLYERGDYVRPCEIDDEDKLGYGLNQRSLEWGYFQMCNMSKLDL
jgi:hypothetical protein